VLGADLGEYILQLAHEPPSHIVAPVVHKSKEEIADLFEEKHHRTRTTQIAELCREAREMLRPGFLSADLGISGANFIIAETGSVLIVTNEGNGRLATTLPRVRGHHRHQKVVPTLEDVSTLLHAAAFRHRPVHHQLRLGSDRHQGKGRIGRAAALSYHSAG
jgi:L-lactate dehydrogenase complex protein LldF